MVALSTLPSNTVDWRMTPSGRSQHAELSRRQLARRTRVTDHLRDEIERLYIDGRSALEVGQELGLAESTVLKVLRERGATVRPWGVKY